MPLPFAQYPKRSCEAKKYRSGLQVPSDTKPLSRKRNLLREGCSNEHRRSTPEVLALELFEFQDSVKLLCRFIIQWVARFARLLPIHRSF